MTTQETTGYGTVIEPGTVRLERLLPGPIDRVWRYITEPQLRRTWLAAGDFDLREGGDIELIWRNSELPGAGYPPSEQDGEEHRKHGRVLACDPPNLLTFTWPDDSEITFVLKTVGDKVRHELTHSRLPDRPSIVGVSTGWHSHLDLLVATLEDRTPAPFWAEFTRLEAEYASRIPE